MIIWLASYPRSGNTFVRTILNQGFGIKTYSIYGDKLDIGNDSATSEMVGHQELPADFNFDKAREADELFFIKTHEQFSIKHERDRAIYIVRDGREATVSFYHYNKNFTQNRYNYLQIIQGQNFVGTWGNHYLSWQEMGTEKCLYFLFEDLIADPLKAMENISGFTGKSALTDKLPTFSDLNKTNPRFFRSGQTDSFLKELSKFEQDYFWLCNGRAMHLAGYTQKTPVELKPQERDELLFTHIQLSGQFLKQSLENSINQLKNQLAQKDTVIKQKDQLIQQKNEELKQKNEEIQAKDLEIKQKREELKLKNDELNQKNSRLKFKRELIEKKTKELQEVKQDISQIEKSLFYKVWRIVTLPVRRKR
jgi:hypothetical protein